MFSSDSAYLAPFDNLQPTGMMQGRTGCGSYSDPEHHYETDGVSADLWHRAYTAVSAGPVLDTMMLTRNPRSLPIFQDLDKEYWYKRYTK